MAATTSSRSSSASSSSGARSSRADQRVIIHSFQKNKRLAYQGDHSLTLRGFFVEASHGYLQFDKYTIMDLADWAHKATLQQGASQAQALETLRCAAIAVMHVHGADDYVHGDIKPQNFLVDLVAAGGYYVA